MTESQVQLRTQLQAELGSIFKEASEFVNTDDFKNLDGLSKDLLITELNSVQTLYGILSIRLGLHQLTSQAEMNTDKSKPESDEKTTTKEE